jgi:glycosyltransferase involved in cell wall biosynthesis
VNDEPARPAVLSVVMPVYNEVTTVAEVLDAVLGVELPDVELQLVVVESNSTDGTRDVVKHYAEDPRVTLVLQREARGKGAAVREGFAHVHGDIVLIQDGDLEYRVDDYGALIEPIITGRADFVLGSRHVKGRAMREFAEAKVTSRVLNAAHWFFAACFNLTYGVRLRDPFTMYKVFRASCIDGIEFESDRFDFDWELVAKLIRLGHKPIEVPVWYRSRGFESGKKVRMWRDPVTWMVALVKFRVQPIRRSTARSSVSGPVEQPQAVR